jgi:hypothetical protein
MTAKGVKRIAQVGHICVRCLFDGVERHFQQYFSYIVAVSYIGGGP